MNKNILKSIFVINAVIFTLVVMSCDLFEDFEDETSEMGTADKTAKETLSDAKIKVNTAILKDWVGDAKFDTTLEIHEVLRTIDHSVGDTNYFIYNGSFPVSGTVTFTITTGEDTTFTVDSTIVIVDTLTDTADTVVYNASVKVTKSFHLNLIRLVFANGKKDTVSFNTKYSEKTLVDLYQALNEMEAGIRVNDEFYTFDTTFSYDTTVFTYDTTISGMDTTVVPDSFKVDTTANIADHLTSYEVETFSDTTESYLLFDNVMSGDVIFFFTDYIYMNLYDEDGNVLETEDSDMPLETVAGYFTVSDKNPVPVIKSRFAYKIEAKKYLIELITHDQTVSRTFKAAIHFDK